MNEAELRRVCLARACEEADPEGLIIPNGWRDRASREAREALGDAADPGRFLALRSERLLERLVRERPALASLQRRLRPVPPALWVCALAFVLGLLADALGTRRQVNLLSFPLFGLLGWNLCVYAALAVRSLAAETGESQLLERVGRMLAGLRLRLGGTTGDVRPAAGRVLARFAGLWFARAGELEQARLQARLHLGAASFALGMLVSLYLAGFAFAYAATWESTFLGPDGVQRLLSIVLGPASSLLGDPLPGVAAIAALEAPASGDAAAWIHRWALTALFFVCAPRFLLAGLASHRAGSVARSLTPDLESPYALRLLAELRGDGFLVRILPYSTELAPGTSALLRELAHELFGTRAQVRVCEPIPYGAPAPEAVSGEGASVVVFNLAQSPEREVHGGWLEKLLGAGGAGEHNGLLVALDERRYRELADPARVEQRYRAWARVLGEVPAQAVRLGGESDADALLEQARRVLAPAAVGASA